MNTIIFTTTNAQKLQSAQSVLGRYGWNVLSTPIEVNEIQSDTAEDVVLDKLKKCFEKLQQPLIAMDSGLFIEPLGGFPGVYTKYILDTIGEDGLLKLTKELQPCPAYVQRVVGYTDGKQTRHFVSRGYGEIIQDKRGTNGRNYDLIFYVPEKKKTLAQMSLDEQVQVWGDAWEQLATWLETRDVGQTAAKC